MLSVNPSLTPSQLLAKMQTSARAFPTGTLRDCNTSLCGAGIVDAAAAVQAAAGTTSTSTTLANGSFEVPALGSSYQYNPSASGIGWTFSSGSGIQGNASAWGAALAPDGTQTAFIQNTGTIAQTLSLAAGSYTISFRAAQRACCTAPYVQPIKLSVDGIQIGSLVSPPNTGFTTFSMSFSVANAGSHTIMFAGTDASGDRSTFIDAVTLATTTFASTSTALASSPNPATLGSTVTFTATVSGSSPNGTVNFSDGGTSISGCVAVGLTGSGNSKTAICSTASLSSGTHSIVASYSSDAANAASSSPALSQVINGTLSTSSNVALASAGAVASASSTYSSVFPVAAVNNNERAGVNWANGDVWTDATANTYPDWVQINFSGTKTIDRVVVYTQQDNYTNPVEPTDTLTFSLYGVTGFRVQDTVPRITEFLI